MYTTSLTTEACTRVTDLQVTRPSDPWEYTDGAIYLVAELCKSAPTEAAALLPQLADVARLTHFPQVGSSHWPLRDCRVSPERHATGHRLRRIALRW